ncbi:preprotein translocase subunit SecE [Candidatus Gracilibacteria bacterium]|nr:preprotein translocase subunit SecE [Candidatus Gracilibacteria bacterium]NUJ98965.1 preprotein translocase subunit SecE [Candidatus Gracilibacteria bacterium]
MIKFFKDSWRELKHVVWPTKEETRKYFLIVITLLFLFGIYLFIFNYFFSEGLFFLKDIVKINF